MSLDVTTDAAIAAIAAAAEEAANTALAATLGQDAVAATKTWPVTTASQVSANDLPCLSVSRASDQEEEQSIYDQVELTTVRIAYIADATPSGKLDARWPLLRSVWNAIIRRLREDATKQRGSDASAMSAAGVYGYQLGSARVTYALLAGTETQHPAFTATAVFRLIGADLFTGASLDALQTIAAEINEADALADTAPVLVTVELEQD